eukprot:SAG31_NODE_89_length_26711_cov_24.949459_15_plen_151_part_00
MYTRTVTSPPLDPSYCQKFQLLEMLRAGRYCCVPGVARRSCILFLLFFKFIDCARRPPISPTWGNTAGHERGGGVAAGRRRGGGAGRRWAAATFDTVSESQSRISSPALCAFVREQVMIFLLDCAIVTGVSRTGWAATAIFVGRRISDSV